MSHLFYEGEVYHKRFSPKKHSFTYPFFVLDIDLSTFETLQNSLFSSSGFNLFSFSSRDHFGKGDDFLENIRDLLDQFGLKSTQKMRFLTLPRIMNYVFNPISVLILFEDEKPTELFAEVHNYNGGRIVYPVKLESKDGVTYHGSVAKDMYVSPFLKRDGVYKFTLGYTPHALALRVVLYEENEKKLLASLSAHSKNFSTKSVMQLFCKHTFLTIWVVTRTLYQSLKLRLKGLEWRSVTSQDQRKRY